jgi:signal transduction histidine kinase
MSIKEMLRRYRQFCDNLKESFTIKVYRSFAISIMIVFLIFTLFFVVYQRSIVKQDLIKEGKMLAGLMAYSSTTGVFAENKDLLKDAVKGIMSQKNVLSVTILTADNRVLLTEEKSQAKKTADPPLNAVKMQMPLSSGGRSIEVIDGQDAVEIAYPVIMETPVNTEESLYFDAGNPAKKQEVIGHVHVVMDKRVLDEEMEAVLFKSAVIAILFLVLSAVAIYISVRRVTRPLTSLTEAVRRFGMGERVEVLPVESKDEVGKLAATFNTMSGNLKKREEEKEALEEKLRNAQKMEAIGTLARGIAHDFNNILSAVRGSVYIMEKKLFDQSPLRQYTEQIHTSLNKAKNLIGSLIAFSRIQAIRAKPIEINGLVGKLRPILASIAGEKVELHISLSDGNLFVCADAVQVEQVLMNLCTNARDAMPDGGALTITTETAIIDGGEPQGRAVMRLGRYALISVTDSGTGIDESMRERIFEPFFTTKEVGKGTGLGLAIVYGIIEQHRGYIDIKTGLEKGTIFEVYLPLYEKDANHEDDKED